MGSIKGKKRTRRFRTEKAQRAKPLTAIASYPDLGVLGGYVGFHLRITQTLSFKIFALQAGEVNLSPGHFAVLMLIGNNPNINQTQLSNANGRDKSSLTPTLSSLEHQGLIQRARLEDNRRTYALKLTPQGEKMRKRLLACAERHERAINGILGDDNAAELVRLLKKLTAGLQKRFD